MKSFQLSKPTHSSTVDVEAIINRGGSEPQNGAGKPQGRKQVIVYFEPKILVEVDEACKASPIKTSRQRWLMEAVHEKLQRMAAKRNGRG